MITTFASGYIGCYSLGCTQFNADKNRYGVVLKSTGIEYKKDLNSNFKEVIGGQRFKKIKLYLGKNCDSLSKEYGKGKWSMFERGFFVELENETFWFIDQEPDIDVDEPTGCRVDEVYVGCYVEGCVLFKAIKNRHGLVLKSTGYQYRFTSSNPERVKSMKKVDKRVIYLGKSCDVLSDDYGKGRWEWVNGEFIIKFKSGVNFYFIDQNPNIEATDKFGCIGN
jgi:hypothetical protein